MKKLLVIEDNEGIRENAAEILQLASYKVCTASNGKEGVEMALKERPDLIICDIMMPELDGYGVLLAVQRNAEIKNTPFIFLSAKSERNEIRKGMELGADDYISKPFGGTELLNAVEGRIKKMEALKQDFSNGPEGVNELLQLSGDTGIMEFLTEGRNIEKYRKKQVIFSEGNRPSRLLYVVKGKVKTYKGNDDGKQIVVGLYGEGDFLGYIALLEGSQYKETAEAMEDSKIAVIPYEDFRELMSKSREVIEKFIKMLARDLTEKEEQLLGIAYNSLRKKVAEALISLQKKYHTSKNERFTINISRENLATIAGTATESLIRTLGDLRDEKLIEISEGRITIINEKKLATILN